MTIAETIIANAGSFAASTLSSAVGELASAMELVQGLGRFVGGARPPPFNLVVPAPRNPGPAPAYTGRHFEARLFTGHAPTLQQAGDLQLPPDPRAAPVGIAYSDPAKPVGEPDFAAVASPPDVTTPSVPSAPNLSVASIPAPLLHAITVPDAPAYQPPEFTGVRPTFDTPMPTDLDVRMRNEYTGIAPVMRAAVAAELDGFLDREFPQYRTGMAAIEARIATYLAGGTALSTAIEDAIYNRTQDKVNIDAGRASRKAYGEAAKRGHTLISVAMTAQQIDLDQERRNANVRAAIDIAVDQAKREQENLQFAVTTSVTLRRLAIDSGLAYYTGLVQLNGQAVEYAKSVVEQVVKAYELAIQHAELSTKIYEAEARIFEAKIRGAMAVLEAYTAQVKGLEAQANVDTAMVNAYRARIEAVQAEANVYRAQVDGVVAAAGIERLKVEIYQARVQGVTAQTAMYNARWQGYEAAVHGETAKQQAAAEQSRAYQAEVQGYAEVVKARGIALNAKASYNEQKTKAFLAEVEAYAALTKGESEAISAEIMSFESTLKAYTAEATAEAEYDKALLASYEAAMRVLIEQVNLYLEQVREYDKMEIARATGITTIATAGAGIYGHIAASALAGMNSLAANVNSVSG